MGIAQYAHTRLTRSPSSRVTPALCNRFMTACRLIPNNRPICSIVRCCSVYHATTSCVLTCFRITPTPCNVLRLTCTIPQVYIMTVFVSRVVDRLLEVIIPLIRRSWICASRPGLLSAIGGWGASGHRLTDRWEPRRSRYPLHNMFSPLARFLSSKRSLVYILNTLQPTQR